MTNGDKIRSMDDKELANFLYKIIGDCDCCSYAPSSDNDDCLSPSDTVSCEHGHLKWLKEQYKGDWGNDK